MINLIKLCNFLMKKLSINEMLRNNQNDVKTTSTPKRRRLGTGRSVRRSSPILNKETHTSSEIKISSRENSCDLRNLSPAVCERDICESPSLPCNQESYESTSLKFDIRLTPSIEECSIIQQIHAENWDSPVITAEINLKNVRCNKRQGNNVFENISNDMFHSKLELQPSNVTNNINIERDENISFKKNIIETFELFDNSISALDSKKQNSVLFGTDSFILDVKETVEFKENNDNQLNREANKNGAGYEGNGIVDFYGLPILAKTLFKMYRNIEKFYDWQEECLNLESVRNRRNLIYALPTSGGKTLVAEVLMMREVLNQKRNALFILPYVAIVQEKIYALSPFAVELEFLVEEYAAGKGVVPPKKRRRKHSIYVATIEKGLALVRSLIELNRLNELGLIIVDELHLIGEAGRGASLESLLTTVIFANPSEGIQIVGMSATIGNLPEIAEFLNADLYQRDFRPVDLIEYVKLGDTLHRLSWLHGELQVVPDRQLSYEYSAAAMALDPDLVGGLVSEVVPRDSCLVFCPTKRSCENVATMLGTLQRREMLEHRVSERLALQEALRAEGSEGGLVRGVRAGVGYHHAGLAGDERRLLEDAFRSGTVSVLCCTSTLAAGVNLPARRVIIRAPQVGRDPLTLAAYRQMAGRAGRAGLAAEGESIIICKEGEWPQLCGVLGGGVRPARSVLGGAGGSGGRALLLSAVGLGLATTRERLRALLGQSLLNVQAQTLDIDIEVFCDKTIRELITSGAIESEGTELTVTKLGSAAIKGCMELEVAQRLYSDLQSASRGLVLLGPLHLLYLVTPQDVAALGIRPDYRHYYNLYNALDEEGVHSARMLGITERVAVRMVTGGHITNVSERVLHRFYAALIVRELWRGEEVARVAGRYAVSRGTVQSLVSACVSLSSGCSRFCSSLPSLWPHAALLSELASRLQHCAAPGLELLMRLPAVKKSRALQLSRAGFGRVETLARAEPGALVAALPHLTHRVATHLVSAAKLMLIEKVENLRAEAEEVMEELRTS